MKTFKLHLIRHGITAGNLQGLYIGSGTDIPLCDEGRAQLKTLVKDFDYPQVPLVFTSPMKRATETADILFPGVRQIELTTDDTPETAAFYRSLGFTDFAGLGCRGFMLD